MCGGFGRVEIVFHFFFQGVICLILSSNFKIRCSFDESIDWISLKILKILEISLHARK